MSFRDLPDDLSSLALDAAHVAADVVDLFCGHASREEGCVLLLTTDASYRLFQPVLVDGVAESAAPEELRVLFASVLPGVHERGGGVIFARGRRGSVLLTDRDRAFHDVLLAACREYDVPLLAAFVATPAVVRAFPDASGFSAAAS